MSKILEFDEERSRRLERMYSTPDVAAQRAATIQALHPVEGDKILDVGTGSGFLADELGPLVGASGEVVGIDVSEAMLAMARAKCASQPWLRFEVGDAVDLPFSDRQFDGAVSAQVFRHIPNVKAALREVWRVLRPGGRFVLLDTDWNTFTWNSGNPELMRKVMNLRDKHTVNPYLPLTVTPKLRATGFEIEDRAAVPIRSP